MRVLLRKTYQHMFRDCRAALPMFRSHVPHLLCAVGWTRAVEWHACIWQHVPANTRMRVGVLLARAASGWFCRDMKQFTAHQLV